MGKNSKKNFGLNGSVNMSTTDEKEVIKSNTINTSNEINGDQSAINSNLKESPIRHVNFNQTNERKSTYVPSNVRRIGNTEDLLGSEETKERPKNIKLVLIPAAALIIFCVINYIFIIPQVLDKISTYILHGEINTYQISKGISNAQLVECAGLTAIVSYSMFSLALSGFAIYNMYKLVYIKRDIIQIAFKILLYTFLIGFVIAAIDGFIDLNLTDIVVKITTFNIYSLVKYL